MIQEGIGCLNLETLYPEYRIRMSADHERGHERDPWNFEIPCGRWKARIYPHGGTRLQASISLRYIKSALSELEAAGATLWQRGDTEASVTFDRDDFRRIARVLRPKKKRVGGGRPFAVKPRVDAGDDGQTGGSDGKDVETGTAPEKDTEK